MTIYALAAVLLCSVVITNVLEILHINIIFPAVLQGSYLHCYQPLMIQSLVSCNFPSHFLFSSYKYTRQHKEYISTLIYVFTGEDEVFLVYEALFPKAALWRNIGMALGVQTGDLDTIDATYPCKPTDCLRSVLERWVRKGYCEERHGRPTWHKVVEAVARPAGGNDNALAEWIAKSHQGKEKGVLQFVLYNFFYFYSTHDWKHSIQGTCKSQCSKQ